MKKLNLILLKYNDSFINPHLEKITQHLDNPKSEVNNNKDKTKNKTKDKENNLTEAHEAIRPTNIEIEELPEDEDVFTAKHRKLYKLIWSNTLESISPAYINN